MRLRHLVPLACLFAAACAAPQSAENGAAPADRDCFHVRSVNGYGDVDEDTIRIDVGPSREYELDLRGGLCDQIKWTTAVALESRPSSWICVGEGAGLGEVHFRDRSISAPITCYIDAVRRVTAAPAAEQAPAEQPPAE